VTGIGRATLLAAILTSACEGWPELDDSEPLEVDRPYRLTLLSVESCALPAQLNPKEVVLVSFRVRLEGNLSSRVPANYFYASLLTSDGERYLPTYYGCEPLLAADPLEPGQRTEGFLNFSIPPSKVPERLAYSPRLVGLSESLALTELNLDEASAEPGAHDSLGLEQQ
jgi:hypothetical protein